MRVSCEFHGKGNARQLAPKTKLPNNHNLNVDGNLILEEGLQDMEAGPKACQCLEPPTQTGSSSQYHGIRRQNIYVNSCLEGGLQVLGPCMENPHAKGVLKAADAANAKFLRALSWLQRQTSNGGKLTRGCE